MANRFEVFVFSACVAVGSAFAAERTWTGASGNWSSADNWSDAMPPVAGDTAILGTVPSGTRTVTMNQAGVEIQQLTLDQQAAEAVNKFVLSADLQINRTDGNDVHKPFVVTTVATNAVQVSLNGHAVRIDGGTGYNDTEVRLDGWWTLGAGSLLDFVQHGYHSAQEFVNDGRLDQTDAEISYRFAVSQHNTTQNGGQRRWVNNGTWTMDHAFFSFDARWTTGSNVMAPGAYGYLMNCENNGTLVMRNASTNVFSTLTNNGLMILEDQSAIGPATGRTVATIRNGAIGEMSPPGTVRVANDLTANAVTYLSNENRMTVGTEEVSGTFDFKGMSTSFTNETTGTLAIAKDSTFTIGYSGNQGHCYVVNNGTIDQLGDMFVDWMATSANTGTRKFENSGLWRLQDGAVFSIMSSSGLTGIWGFSAVANAINAGRIELGDGAQLGLNALSNNGTLTMASNAYLGIRGLKETRSYVNCGVIEVTGIDNYIGQGEPIANGNNTTFDQNAAPEGSGLEPLLAVGTNDTDAASLILASGADCTVTFNAGRVKIGAQASLTAACLLNVESKNRAVNIYNYAEVVQKGTVCYRPRGNVWSRFYNYGTWTIDATDEAPARFVRGIEEETTGFSSVFNNNGSFGGRGTVIFSDITGRKVNTWLLTTYGGADLVVGAGGLTLTDGQIKFAVSGEAAPRIVYDLGATADGFGGLTINGEKGVYEQQQAKLDVVLKFPKKTAGWSGRHTLRLVTAPNVKSNNNRISSVTAVYDDGTPADNIDLGTPVYGATTIDLDVKVKNPGFAIFLR